uniref:Uncharacterized protein n=1 Tax=Pithovirus LCPAC404 TaxID=2506597 RepID=A0A481ZC53_9VIRU|nr:MAG: hypothetical protein LCPAC404_02270 [Pithovirus LCPAC404]
MNDDLPNFPTLKQISKFKKSLEDIKPFIPCSTFRLARFSCTACSVEAKNDDYVSIACDFIKLYETNKKNIIKHISNVKQLMLTEVVINSRNNKLVFTISKNFKITIRSCTLTSIELTDVLNEITDARNF